MRHHRSSEASGKTRHPVTLPRFMRLYDLSDYTVAHGEPDVRGWHVQTANGERAGRVDSLIVDTEVMLVRYLDVELDRKTYRLKDERHVLLPLAQARLDDAHDQVLLDTITAAEVASLQPYNPGQPIRMDQAPDHRDADTRRFYGARGGTGALRRRSGRAMEDDAHLDTRRDTRPARSDDQNLKNPLGRGQQGPSDQRALPTEDLVTGHHPPDDDTTRADPVERRDH